MQIETFLIKFRNILLHGLALNINVSLVEWLILVIITSYLYIYYIPFTQGQILLLIFNCNFSALYGLPSNFVIFDFLTSDDKDLIHLFSLMSDEL